MTKIVAIADTHGATFDVNVPSCDLLIIGGDICPNYNHQIDFQKMWVLNDFATWANTLNVGNIVLIAGNHDFVFQSDPYIGEKLMSAVPNLLYLEDSLCYVPADSQKGDIGGYLSVWGSPWSLNFGPWAFMGTESELKEKHENIPIGVDIVVSHTPMYGFGDHTADDYYAGGKNLRQKIKKIQPKLFVCGHIHEGYGHYKYGDTLIKNASLRDEYYNMKNDPMVITLPLGVES